MELSFTQPLRNRLVDVLGSCYFWKQGVGSSSLAFRFLEVDADIWGHNCRDTATRALWNPSYILYPGGRMTKRLVQSSERRDDVIIRAFFSVRLKRAPKKNQQFQETFFCWASFHFQIVGHSRTPFYCSQKWQKTKFKRWENAKGTRRLAAKA